jgi:AdoMet-dependent rRNA methyltransferase SPB1
MDDQRILEHPQTTSEIKECVKDIKVLGRREISLILAWRRHMAASLFKKTAPAVEPSTEENKTEEPTEKDEEDNDDDDVDKDVEEQLLKLNEQQRKEAKRLGYE